MERLLLTNIPERPSREDTTMVIKVQYDALTRTFRLVDQEFTTLFEGDAFYDLVIPILFEESGIEESFSESGVAIAHA
jgi:hypothetical protein